MEKIYILEIMMAHSHIGIYTSLETLEKVKQNAREKIKYIISKEKQSRELNKNNQNAPDYWIQDEKKLYELCLEEYIYTVIGNEVSIEDSTNGFCMCSKPNRYITIKATDLGKVPKL